MKKEKRMGLYEGEILKFPDFSDDAVWEKIANVAGRFGPFGPTKEQVLYQSAEQAALFLALQAEGFWYFWENGTELNDERVFRQLKESPRAKQYQTKFLEMDAYAYGVPGFHRFQGMDARTIAIREFVDMMNAEAMERSWNDHFEEIELKYSGLLNRIGVAISTTSKKTFRKFVDLYSEFMINYVLFILRAGGVVVDGAMGAGQVALEKTGELVDTAWEKSGGREWWERNKFLAYATAAVGAVGVVYQITREK